MISTTDPLLSIDHLRVRFAGRTEDAVRGVSLHVNPGEVVALVGESGSGKSVTSLTAMGLLPSTATAGGSIRVKGADGERQIIGAAHKELDDLRGRVMSMVFQEPMTALNPTMQIGDQIAESLLNHTRLRHVEARLQAVELMRSVGLPDPERRARQFPHELSGGQRQRVVIAMALACEPSVIIADEPTTALDVTVQAEILELLRRLVQERGTGLLIITHNMGVVADLADRVYVMRHGEVLEHGPVRSVLGSPEHEYTRSLLAAIPALPQAAFGSGAVSPAEPTAPEPAAAPPSDVGRVADTGEPILSLEGVTAGYRVNGRHITAVEDIDLRVHAGEIVGLVGESGSGKSTVSRIALGLLPPSHGGVQLFGHPLGRRFNRKITEDIGVVFQDPGGSLNPRMTVGEAIAEPLAVHRPRMQGTTRRQRVAELLDAVRLPADAARRYPHEFSGGQRQRIGLARALVLKPRLLVADEPTSALDVSVQAEVLDVLRALHEEMGFGCLFVSHDLGVINTLTHRVVVMRDGQIVEQGATQALMHAPSHPYTQRLLASVPLPDPVAQHERRAAYLSLRQHA